MKKVKIPKQNKLKKKVGEKFIDTNTITKELYNNFKIKWPEIILINRRTFKLINLPKYEIVSIATKLFAKKPGVPIGASKLKKFILKRVTAIKVVQKIKPVAINVVK